MGSSKEQPASQISSLLLMLIWLPCGPSSAWVTARGSMALAGDFPPVSVDLWGPSEQERLGALATSSTISCSVPPPSLECVCLPPPSAAASGSTPPQPPHKRATAKSTLQKEVTAGENSKARKSRTGRGSGEDRSWAGGGLQASEGQSAGVKGVAGAGGELPAAALFP